MSGAAIEGSDPRRAVMAFLEGANFIFHHSSVLGDTFLLFILRVTNK